MRLPFATLFSWLFIVPPSAALAGGLRPDDIPVTGVPKSGHQAFDRAMRQFMAERGINGGVLAVSRNGKIIISKGYGWRDPERHSLIDRNAPMRIASLSKPITMAAIHLLIRNGKLRLSDKIVDLLVISPPTGKRLNPKWRQITVKHLLEHRGGWDKSKAAIGDPMFQSLEIARALGKKGPASAQDIITYMAAQPLEFEPGEKTSYSNFGYCLLGRVIEKASGKSYIEFVKQDLLGPIGVRSVALARTLPKDRNPLEPVYVDKRKVPSVFSAESREWVPYPDGGFHIEAMDAHGGLIISAPDMLRFLDHYWMNGQPILPGEFGNWVFFGSLPGTFAVARQRRDGTNYVAIFNGRSGKDDRAIRDLLDKAAATLSR